MTKKNFIIAHSRTPRTIDLWETPMYFFKLLDNEFNFTLDPCASKENRKCKKFYSEETNGLIRDWKGETAFVNPPFSDIKEWVRKCYNEGQKDKTTVVMIIPSRTDTKYWHKFVMKAHEIRFCVGRVNFLRNGEKAKNGSAFPLSVVIFKKSNTSSPKISSFNHKNQENGSKLDQFIRG